MFTSAIGKRPLAGPVRVTRLGLAGDQVADTRVHGGPDQAVLAYASAHYPGWRAEWGRDHLPPSPCIKLASYQRQPDLITRVRDTGRSGWDLRVIVEGDLEAGAAIERSARPYPELSVRRVAIAMANRHQDPDEALRLVHCTALAQDWRLRLAREGFRRRSGS